MSLRERFLTPEVLTFLSVGGVGYVVDVVSYVGNRALTWRGESVHGRRREIALFVLFDAIGLGLSVVTLTPTKVPTPRCGRLRTVRDPSTPGTCPHLGGFSCRERSYRLRDNAFRPQLRPAWPHPARRARRQSTRCRPLRRSPRDICDASCPESRRKSSSGKSSMLLISPDKNPRPNGE